MFGAVESELVLNFFRKQYNAYDLPYFIAFKPWTRNECHSYLFGFHFVARGLPSWDAHLRFPRLITCSGCSEASICRYWSRVSGNHNCIRVSNKIHCFIHPLRHVPIKLVVESRIMPSSNFPHPFFFFRSGSESSGWNNVQGRESRIVMIASIKSTYVQSFKIRDFEKNELTQCNCFEGVYFNVAPYHKRCCHIFR